MKDNNPLHGWHLKKEVTIGQIITMITITTSIFIWASTVETRLAVLERNDEIFINRVERGEKRFEAALTEIKQSLMRIEDRLFTNRQ